MLHTMPEQSKTKQNAETLSRKPHPSRGDLGKVGIAALLVPATVLLVPRAVSAPEHIHDQAEYDTAVSQAVELAKHTEAADLYDCNVTHITLPEKATDGKPSRYAIADLAVTPTELSESGYFAEGGVAAGDKRVEITWVSDVEAYNITGAGSDQKRLPGLPLHPSEDTDKAQSPDNVQQFLVPLGNLAVDGEGETRIQVTVQYVNAGSASLTDLPKTAVDCGAIRTVVSGGELTVLGATDSSGTPLEIER